MIDIYSRSDCQDLISRIRTTLSAVRPSVLKNIHHYPPPFQQNDGHIFECLTWAVLSNGTKWNSLKPRLPAIKRILFGYNLTQIASLSDVTIDEIYQRQIEPLSIPSRILLTTKLRWTRDNAKTFLQIQERYGSAWCFIKGTLGGAPDLSHDCYLHPQDDRLLTCFVSGPYKLKGVGKAICCEFFNNIGVDEFKPDVHTTRFFNRVDLDRTRLAVSQKPDDVRAIGIKIAETLQQPRKFVDSHIWCFCAEGEGEICTEDDPKCGSCSLKTKQPQLCAGVL